MFADITMLEEFYQSPVGQTAAYYIRQKLVFEDDTKLLGIGYVEPFLERQDDVFVMAPAQQGVMESPNYPTVLAYEDHLPFADSSIRHILLAHVLESTDYLHQMLQECWRVLDAHGQVTIILPSRRGLWTKNDTTPFSYGRPFAAQQAEEILMGHRFEVESYTRALYFLPKSGLFGYKQAKLMEKIGFRFFTRMGGVIIIQARKEVFSRIRPKRVLPRIGLKDLVKTGPGLATNKTD